MDDYSIKVLSWIGISMVITYRRFFLNSNEGRSHKEGHIIYRRRKPYDDVSELIRKNIEMLIALIKEDTDFLIERIRRDKPILTRWKTGDTKTLHESNFFQMTSLTGKDSAVRYRIVGLPKPHEPARDEDELLKWMDTNAENVNVCSNKENDTLTEWINDNKEAIINSIRKDTKTFIEMIRGEKKLSDARIRKDIEILTKTPWLSCECMDRHYSIILSKITINKECKLKDKETMTELGKKITECIQVHKETMTEVLVQDKAMITEQTTHVRDLFQPGCPTAIEITPTTIKLTWDEPIAGADWYEITCEQKHISVVCYYKTSENSCEYIVKGLKSNTDYEFTIQAVKNEVNKGPYSEALKVSTSVISNYSIAELLYICFYIVVLIWFTYLLCYIVLIRNN